jgi:hypothetical protein
MMLRPSCKGTGECHQGRSPCRTPLTCSGYSADEAIEMFNRKYGKTVPPRHPIPPQPTWAAPPWQESEENRTPEVERIAMACVEFTVAIVAATCAAAAIASMF